MSLEEQDLIILAADTDAEFALEGVLSRPERLGIRSLRYKIDQHPMRDGGCRSQGVSYLRAFRKQFKHSLLIFDHEGCGAEGESAGAIETRMEAEMDKAGWAGQSAVIVIEPELDAWVWSDSPHVSDILGWKTQSQDLHAWLESEGWIEQKGIKPHRPKEALDAVLRKVRKPHTAALYRDLAENVSLQGCTDRAFAKLRSILLRWFKEGA
jgi:hypothetical protein